MGVLSHLHTLKNMICDFFHSITIAFTRRQEALLRRRGKFLWAAGDAGRYPDAARPGNAASTTSPVLSSGAQHRLTIRSTNIRLPDREQARVRQIGCWSTRH